MQRKFWSVVSMVLVLALLISACAPKATPTPTPKPVVQPTAKPTAVPPTAVPPTPKPAETLKIAILGPLTGANATFGAGNRDGAIMAFEEWNAKGGVIGKKIEWVLGDSQCDPKAGADAAKKAIDEDKVKYIVGAVCSSESIPISQYANEKHVVQVSGTSTNPKVTVDDAGKVKPFTFRVCFIDTFQGTVMANFALKNLKAKTAAVVWEVGNDYIKGLAEFFKSAFEAGGGKVLVYESYVKEDTDFSAILSKVKAASPDVFAVPTYYDKVNLIGAQAKQKGITAPMIGGDGWDSADLDLAAADGGYFVNHYHKDDPRPIVQDFVKRYQAKYNTAPDALATLGYDAATAMLEGIKAAGVDDPDKVAAAMEKIKFEAVSGQVTFDQFHNPVKSAAILAVKNGKVTFQASVAP
jgi:branched-chain amino acid transport system substrate-binding protein